MGGIKYSCSTELSTFFEIDCSYAREHECTNMRPSIIEFSMPLTRRILLCLHNLFCLSVHEIRYVSPYDTVEVENETLYT